MNNYGDVLLNGAIILAIIVLAWRVRILEEKVRTLQQQIHS